MKSILGETEFAKNGFKVTKLLTQNSILKLQSIYEVLNKSSNEGFFTSLNFEKKEDRLWANNEIIKTLEPHLKYVLPNYKPFLGSFTIKKKGESSNLSLHLDWSVTDEKMHKAVVVWIPLCDTDENNGALGVLRGSHKFGYTLRGSLINFLYCRGEGPNILTKIAQKYDAVKLHLQTGNAVIYDLSLAHFSNSNLSIRERVAINLIMVPEAAETYHFKRRGNKIYKIPITANDILENSLGNDILSEENSAPFIISDDKDIEEQHLQLTDIKIVEIQKFKVVSSNNRFNEFCIKKCYKLVFYIKRKMLKSEKKESKCYFQKQKIGYYA